jgi:hypothetical protein
MRCALVEIATHRQSLVPGSLTDDAKLLVDGWARARSRHHRF